MDKLINTRREVLMLVYPFINYLSQTLVFAKDNYPILIKMYHFRRTKSSVIFIYFIEEDKKPLLL